MIFLTFCIYSLPHQFQAVLRLYQLVLPHHSQRLLANQLKHQSYTSWTILMISMNLQYSYTIMRWNQLSNQAQRSFYHHLLVQLCTILYRKRRTLARVNKALGGSADKRQTCIPQWQTTFFSILHTSLETHMTRLKSGTLTNFLNMFLRHMTMIF